MVDDVVHGNVTEESTVPGPLSAASCQFRTPFVDNAKSELVHDAAMSGAVRRAAVGGVYVVPDAVGG